MRIEEKNVEGSCIECGGRDTNVSMKKIIFERKVGKEARITHPICLCEKCYNKLCELMLNCPNCGKEIDIIKE